MANKKLYITLPKKGLNVTESEEDNVADIIGRLAEQVFGEKNMDWYVSVPLKGTLKEKKAIHNTNYENLRDCDYFVSIDTAFRDERCRNEENTAFELEIPMYIVTTMVRGRVLKPFKKFNTRPRFLQSDFNGEYDEEE